ncbi:hypothetical protein EEL31_23900 [Brevibacillus laterosporus]|nr:baseplate J/gp47 family protein [Brevibacillus laterosporus]TPG71175.1 hypothetical protein EEL31_23900 [Brevibacillus laterosporus]
MSDSINKIHNEMLQDIDDRYDVSLGSFFYDGTRPIAKQLATRDEEQAEMVERIFPQTTKEDYFLELWVEANGMKRKQGRCSESESFYEFICDVGTLIPQGTPVFPDTNPSLIFLTTTDAVASDGIARTPIIAQHVGIAYNLKPNTINRIGTSIDGFYSCTNPTATIGGADREPFEELKKRFLESKANPNLGGADRDYIRWAKEVNGVYDVKVIPEWEGFGTNSVKLVIYGEHGESLDSSIIQSVVDHIVSPNDRTKRIAPSSAHITIVTSESVPIDITISSLLVKEGYTFDTVQGFIQVNLKRYIDSVKPFEIVKVKSLESIVTETAGVYDFKSLLINGSNENIPTTDEQKVKLGKMNYAK